MDRNLFLFIVDGVDLSECLLYVFDLEFSLHLSILNKSMNIIFRIYCYTLIILSNIIIHKVQEFINQNLIKVSDCKSIYLDFLNLFI